MKKQKLEVAPVEPLAYSIDEAAALCRIGRTTMYGLVNGGNIKSVRISPRRVIILKGELESFLVQMEQGGLTLEELIAQRANIIETRGGRPAKKGRR